ncbi:hypothetical protein Tco_1170893 [Tanacetum coccineum]
MATTKAIKYAPQCGDMIFIIKFTVKSDQTPLTLDYKTLCETKGLDYNSGQYVDHPSTEVLGGNHSFTEQLNLIQQLIVFSLLTKTKIDIGEIIFNDLDQKFRNLPSVLSQTNFTKNPSKVTSIELTASMIDVIDLESLMTPLPCSKKKGKKKTQIVAQPEPKSQGRETSRALPRKGKMSSGQTTDPQDIEGNIKVAVKGLPSSLDEGTCSSKPLSEGKPIDAKDPGETNNPLVWDHLPLTLMKVLAKQSLYQRGPLLIPNSQGETYNSLI